MVANRGEIACRVFRTCQKLGIKTVAIYSDPDADAMHVRMADEAVRVGPAPSAESYLVIDNILDAIKQTGTQAVHPGYGFLSENSEFAAALEREGVAFVGPREHAISVMGDKIESKQCAIDAKVNVIPGVQDLVETDEQVIKVCHEIGYPVMIKASAGGGGKGMRIARDDDEALEAFRLSKAEALSSFGDDRIFIEKFVDNPRHIEIQILADEHGNVVPFPERECSIQRRNQKVVEEAPSVLLDPETRFAMGEQAAQLARAVDYRGAGTVEFLCDGEKNFYFLEMNTRLQVEHPITELVSGVDLVEHMLNIAAGRPLPDELLVHSREGRCFPINGWAIESRIYAEDPFRSFLPSIGTLTSYTEPEGEAVRVDSGVTEGSEISMFYDPMISKLCTWGEDRAQAVERMNDALDSYLIGGLQHNVPFCREVCRHPKFLSGDITTKFIEEEYPDGFSGVVLTADERAELLACAAIVQMKLDAQASMIDGKVDEDGPIPLDDDLNFEEVWGEDNTVEYVAVLNGEEEYNVSVQHSVFDGAGITVHLQAKADGAQQQELSIELSEAPTFASPFLRAEINGSQRTAQILGSLPEGMRMQFCGSRNDVTLRSPRAHELAAHMLPKVEVDTSKFLLCPMPGSLISVAVEAGQTVEAGQELAVVEAMKMQNVLYAEKRGVIKTVAAEAGSTLKVDDVIVEFEDENE